MPAKNVIKLLDERSFYHVYNRGVEKRTIFLDDQDFRVLLFYFKLYLTNPDSLKFLISEKTALNKFDRIDSILRAINNNFYQRIQLHCYALMPNHFHLLIRQENRNDLPSFMKSIFTKYSMYFNKRHQRIGKLFQGAYKAVKIGNDESLLQVSRYIHLNPKDVVPSSTYEHWENVFDYPYSSCRYYLYEENISPSWLIKTEIEQRYKPSEYRSFLDKGDSLEGVSLQGDTFGG